MAKDPVCGMEVDPQTATHKVDYEGQTYYFCAPGCRKAFRCRSPEVPGPKLQGPHVSDAPAGPGAASGPHGPDHQGCPTCDPLGGQPPLAGRPRLSTVGVRALGEQFRIVQLQGQLFVCTRQNGSCCRGWEEKGRLPFDPASLWGEEWERRKIRNRIHLSFTGCLGPCAAGNNALLQLHGRSIWLKDLNDPALVPLVFDYAKAMLDAGAVLPVPDGLGDHVYERFVSPPEGAWLGLAEDHTEAGDGLDRLDPVCLMDVDPATTRHKVEYGGRTIVFCAPSCKKLFLEDPAAYLVV